jgi:transposase
MEKVQSTQFGKRKGGRRMKRPEVFVGIDIGSANFFAAAGKEDKNNWQLTMKPKEFINDYDSLPQFLLWLRENHILPNNAIVCMEATGVYNEILAHFLVNNQYRISIESPLEVKRAFKPIGHKTDAVDSTQIAEYAYRFYDELRVWAPREAILEQIKTLLATREQFSKQKTAQMNTLKALERKQVRTPLAEALHKDVIERLKKNMLEIEKEIERLIDQDPANKQLVGLMMSIPGVGFLLATHLLIAFESSPEPYNPKKMAAFIGICPYKHSSGTSINRTPSSRHYGLPGLRRLLFLAAMSVRTHNDYFRNYFMRKVLDGKARKLVINNIENKLLKIICAVARTGTPYIPGYRSVHPQLLMTKKVLTMS